MTELHQYIEDYILGRPLSDDIKLQIEKRLQSDQAFALDVNNMRQVIEGLQLAGIKSRVVQKINRHDNTKTLKTKRINLMAIALVAILACIMLIVYIKNRNIASPAPPPKEQNQTIESKTIPLVSGAPTEEVKQDEAQQNRVEAKPKINVPSNTKKPDVQPTNEHAAIAMNYFSNRLPLASGSRGKQSEGLSLDEKALAACLDLIEKRDYVLAKKCLDTNFGKREEDAEWFRALLTLATEGKSAANDAIKLIAENRMHIYSRQAKELNKTFN